MNEYINKYYHIFKNTVNQTLRELKFILSLFNICNK